MGNQTNKVQHDLGNLEFMIAIVVSIADQLLSFCGYIAHRMRKSQLPHIG